MKQSVWAVQWAIPFNDHPGGWRETTINMISDQSSVRSLDGSLIVTRASSLWTEGMFRVFPF